MRRFGGHLVLDFRAAVRCVAMGILLTTCAFGQKAVEDPTDRLVAAGWSRDLAARIAARLVSPRGKIVAVFDHDGTLMSGDVTEGHGPQPGVMRSMIEEGRCRPEGLARISPEMRSDPWKAYKAWTAHDPMHAYAWLPTLLAGHTTREVDDLGARWYGACYQHYLFPEMLALLQVLREHSAEVWIVSASAQPLVRPAAQYTGVPPERILGIRLKKSGEVVQPEVEQPISFAAGKVWYIQHFIRPAVPANLMVFGDSYRTDGPMLRMAARSGGLAVLINAKPEMLPRLAVVGVLHQSFASTDRLENQPAPGIGEGSTPGRRIK